MADDMDESDELYWSDLVVDDDVAFDDPALTVDNLEVFRELQELWPGGFFQVMGDEWEVGRRLAQGAQTEIYEAERTLPDGTKDKWVLKTFDRRSSLRDMMKYFPIGMLTNLGPNGCYSNGRSCSIYGVMMLQDGRLAILMKRYWGDLRSLIDLIMRLNNNQECPFPDMSMVVQIILDIALGMQALHEDGIVHGDVKAGNALIWPLGDDYDPIHGGKFKCHVADFEMSVGVLGTGFWRAPEILLALKNRNMDKLSNWVTEKSDVYSFAMTCYEILTGRVPFEDYTSHYYDVIIGGTRPELPHSIDLWIKKLLEMCWHQDPFQRPSFEEIVDILQAKSREREPNIPAPRQGKSRGRELDIPTVPQEKFGPKSPNIRAPRQGKSCRRELDIPTVPQEKFGPQSPNIRAPRQARFGARGSYIPAPRSSTWEEFNDPRVRRVQDPSMEVLDKFPILIEMLAAALQCCEEEAEKIKMCKDQVGMFKFQCAHLVKTLSSDADKVFFRFQQVRKILKQLVIMNAHRQQLELSYWFTCVAFGIHSLVDLTRNFQIVVEMLSKCGVEDWWKTALQYSTTPAHPQIPRWSVFGLALQQCQWSMDIARLAVKEITDLVTGFGDWMFNDLGFQWCEERKRAVLQNTEEPSGSLGVVATLEAQDRDELLRKLEMFLCQSLSVKSHKNEFRLASFLKTKLAGPVPQPMYLPYTFQIDPPVNLVSRSRVTAIWCAKVLCHVKKVKAQEHEVRKIMEVDAAPLAAVQHPNVVQLIGCTVQTSGHVTGLTEILTKVMYPSKKKLLHEATGVMVMELMEGDLRKLLDQRCPNPRPGSRPFPLIVALDIMLQIAEAMRFVHEHEILHRDLKTTNILFYSASSGASPSYPALDLDRIRELELLYLLTPERFYTVKVADFDLAQYSPNKPSHIVHAKTGTPRYMAPEMFYNSEAEVPSEYNWSCDVYSFAMTCSAILTGNEPFHFIKNTMDNMASVVDRTAQVQVRPDLGLGDALPSLKVLIERCWDKDPLKRPPFSEICRELWDCKVKATISCLRRQ